MMEISPFERATRLRAALSTRWPGILPDGATRDAPAARRRVVRRFFSSSLPRLDSSVAHRAPPVSSSSSADLSDEAFHDALVDAIAPSTIPECARGLFEGDVLQAAGVAPADVHVITQGEFIDDKGTTLPPGSFVGAVAYAFKVETHRSVTALKECDVVVAPRAVATIEATPDEHAAATKIQAMARGNAARRGGNPFGGLPRKRKAASSALRTFSIPWAALDAMKTSSTLRAVYETIERSAMRTREEGGILTPLPGDAPSTPAAAAAAAAAENDFPEEESIDYEDAELPEELHERLPDELTDEEYAAEVRSPSPVAPVAVAVAAPAEKEKEEEPAPASPAPASPVPSSVLPPISTPASPPRESAPASPAPSSVPASPLPESLPASPLPESLASTPRPEPDSAASGRRDAAEEGSRSGSAADEYAEEDFEEDDDIPDETEVPTALELLTVALKAQKADARTGAEATPARRAIFAGMDDDAVVKTLASHAVLSHVKPGVAVAKHGDPENADGGALFVIAKGSCRLVKSDGDTPASKLPLLPGDTFGEVNCVTSGDAGFPATMIACEPDGADVYIVNLARVGDAIAASRLVLLTLKEKTRESVARHGDDFLTKSTRGKDVVLIADAVPHADALARYAMGAGSFALTYDHANGSMKTVIDAAKSALGDGKHEAATMMLVTPPPSRPGSIDVVAAESIDAASVRREKRQEDFLRDIGGMCKPWGALALAHGPGVDAAAISEGVEFAAEVVEVVGVEVVPSYELGKENGSESFEATNAAMSRATAKHWRAEAVDIVKEKEEAAERERLEREREKAAAAAREEAARVEAEEKRAAEERAAAEAVEREAAAAKEREAAAARKKEEDAKVSPKMKTERYRPPPVVVEHKRPPPIAREEPVLPPPPSPRARAEAERKKAEVERWRREKTEREAAEKAARERAAAQSKHSPSSSPRHREQTKAELERWRREKAEREAEERAAAAAAATPAASPNRETRVKQTKEQVERWRREKAEREAAEKAALAAAAAAVPPPPKTDRVAYISKKLGVTKKAATAALKDLNISVFIDPGVTPAGCEPLKPGEERENVVLAGLLLLEARLMSSRLRKEYDLSLALATELAEATHVLKMIPGSVDLVKFKTVGEDLVGAVRRKAIRAGKLTPTANDAVRNEASNKVLALKKKKEAEMFAKREDEIAAVARVRKEKAEAAVAAAAAAAARKLNITAANSPKGKSVRGSFLERLQKDVKKRGIESKPRAATARLKESSSKMVAEEKKTPPTPEEAAARKRLENRAYLRSVIRDRLVAAGVHDLKPGEGVPKDDKTIVEIIRAHAKHLGIKWWKKAASSAKTARASDAAAAADDEENAEPPTSPSTPKMKKLLTPEEAEKKRLSKHARDAAKACERLRRVDFLRRLSDDLDKRVKRREETEKTPPRPRPKTALASSSRSRKTKSESGDGIEYQRGVDSRSVGGYDTSMKDVEDEDCEYSEAEPELASPVRVPSAVASKKGGGGGETRGILKRPQTAR